MMTNGGGVGPGRTPRVLHVVYNLIRGGTEGQCARVAMALRQRVAVSHREGFFLEAVESACGPVYEMRIRHLVGFQTLGEVRRLARFIREEEVELVHAWDADAAIFGSWAAIIAGVPYITSRRDLGEIYSPQKRLLMTQADLGARAIVANAAAIKKNLFDDRRIARKVRVISNLLDLDEFDRQFAMPFSRRQELPPGRRVVLVSRLDPEKNVASFIRAAARVSLPDVSFVIAGDGMERAPLAALAAELRLGPRLVFLGEVNEVPALLRECSVGVLVPHANEGLSNSILEYMAAGLPVVATDCGGNGEVVEHGRTGMIVPVGDVVSIASGIVHVLQNGSGKMSAEARKRVEARNCPQVISAEFAKLHRDAIGA